MIVILLGEDIFVVIKVVIGVVFVMFILDIELVMKLLRNNLLLCSVKGVGLLVVIIIFVIGGSGLVMFNLMI